MLSFQFYRGVSHQTRLVTATDLQRPRNSRRRRAMANAVMQIWLSTMTMMVKLLQMATAPTMVTDLQEKMEPVEAMVMLPRKIPWVPLLRDPLRPHLLGERRTIKHQALLELEKSYHQFPNQHWEPWVIIPFSSKETFWLVRNSSLQSHWYSQNMAFCVQIALLLLLPTSHEQFIL